MKSHLILILIQCTNLIYCATLLPTTDESANIPTTITTSSSVVPADVTKTILESIKSHNNNNENNKSNLHRVQLISSKNNNDNDNKKTWSSLFDDLLITSNDEINQQQQSNGSTTCSEQCKDHFGVTNNDIDKFQSCINGCRYYTINLIMAQKNISAGIAAAASSSSVKSECFNSCEKVYPNDTKSISICNFGCRLADSTKTDDPKTEPIQSISSVDEQNDLDDNNNKDEKKRTISMFIPLRTLTSTNEMIDDRSPPTLDQIFGQNNGPSSLSRIMMSMVRSMADRARQMMDFARSQQRKMEDERLSMDFDSSSNTVSGVNGDGEAVSFERSMSVMMTKDKDGHKKVVVMHEPPKITIHRAWNPLGLEIDRFNNEKTNYLDQHLKELQQEQQEQMNENKFRVLVPWKWSGFGWNNNNNNNNNKQEKNIDEETFGSRIFQQFHPFSFSSSNQQNNFNDVDHNADDDVMVINTVDPNKSESVKWSACLISMMPLLYLLMVILLLYIIIWLFYSVPNYFTCRNRRNRELNGNMPNVNLPSPLFDDNYREKSRMLYQKLFHLSRPQRYCKLSSLGNIGEKFSPLFPSSKSSSPTKSPPTGVTIMNPPSPTLSFPPPYTSVVEDLGKQISPETEFSKDTTTTTTMKEDESKK